MHERGGEGSPVWTVFFQPFPDWNASVGAADADSEFGDGHNVRQVLSNVGLGRGTAESEVGAVAGTRRVGDGADVVSSGAVADRQVDPAGLLAGVVGPGQLGLVGVDVLGVPVGRGVTVGGHGFLAALPAGFDGVGCRGLGLDARLESLSVSISLGGLGVPEHLGAVVTANLCEVLLEVAGALLEEELVGAHVPFGGPEGFHVLVDAVEGELLGDGILVGLDAQLEGQVVHLQVGHAVDLSGDPVRGDVGAAGAQGGATVGEARDVGDATGGHGSLAGAHRLFDGAGTPQEAGAVGSHDLGSVCVDGQLAALITEVGAGRVDSEGDGVGGRGPSLEGGDRSGDLTDRLRVQVGGQGYENRCDEGSHGREDERDFRTGAREPRRPRMAWR